MGIILATVAKPVGAFLVRVWPYIFLAAIVAAIVYLADFLWDMHGRANYNRGLSDARIEAAIQLERENAQAVEQLVRMEADYTQRLADAHAAANKRVLQAANDTADARAAVGSLRADIAKAKSDYAEADEAARKEYTDTLADVLEESTARYSELAAKADGHAADVQLLEDAWPVQSETFNEALKNSELSGKTLTTK